MKRPGGGRRIVQKAGAQERTQPLHSFAAAPGSAAGSTALSLDGFRDEAMAILRDGVVSAHNNGSLRTGGFYADLVGCTALTLLRSGPHECC